MDTQMIAEKNVALAATANLSMHSSTNTRAAPADQEETFAGKACSQRCADSPSHSIDGTHLPKNLNGLFFAASFLACGMMQ
jgi:hypothetical protein